MKLSSKWEEKAPGIHVRFIKKARPGMCNGRPLIVTEAVRVTNEAGGYRIDFAGNVAGAWLPWEPIDETVYRTVTAAKKAVAAYAKRVG